jgi:hypothetical protein
VTEKKYLFVYQCNRQPCLAPDLILVVSVKLPFISALHENSFYICYTKFIILIGIPKVFIVCHIFYIFILSNAFSKSIKGRCRVDWYSIVCSIIILSVFIWSMHDRFSLKPASPRLNLSSTGLQIILI